MHETITKQQIDLQASPTIPNAPDDVGTVEMRQEQVLIANDENFGEPR